MARFGSIPTGTDLGASQSVRRNAANDGWEAFDTTGSTPAAEDVTDDDTDRTYLTGPTVDDSLDTADQFILVLYAMQQGGFSVAASTTDPPDFTIGVDTLPIGDVHNAHVVAVDGLTSPLTITLPDLSAYADGLTPPLVVKCADTSAATHTITIDGNGSQDIDGAAGITITDAYGAVMLHPNGGRDGWHVVARYPATGGGGASALDDLSDVTITAAASGDILRHNGTAWVDAAGISGADITSGTVAEARIDSAIARDSEVIPVSLLTTRGDLIRRGSSAPERVALGTSGQLFASDGTDAVWAWGHRGFFPIGTGRYLRSQGSGYTAQATGSTASNSQNTVVYMPILLARRETIQSLACVVQAANAGASAVVFLGIYSPHATSFLPDSLVVSAGSASLNSTGLKEIAISGNQVLEPGLYWVAVKTQGLDTGGTNPTFSCPTVYDFMGSTASVSTGNNLALHRVTEAYGTSGLPSTATVATDAHNASGTTQGCVYVWARAA